MQVEAFAPRPGVGELRQHEAQPLVAEQKHDHPIHQAQQTVDQVVHVLHVEQWQLAYLDLPRALTHQLCQAPAQLAPAQVGALDKHHEHQCGDDGKAQRLEHKTQAARLAGFVHHLAQGGRCLLGGRAGVAALHAQVLRRDDEGPAPTQQHQVAVDDRVNAHLELVGAAQCLLDHRRGPLHAGSRRFAQQCGV
ncbi:hypothetical protein D3C81_1337950 [compost metagenome]